jgi:hypothetical protein
MGVAVDAVGCVYVVDSYDDRLQKFTGDRRSVSRWVVV